MQARPLTPTALREALADQITATHPDRRLRVALDGAAAADPAALGHALIDPLRVRGRATILLHADDFLRPASLRLEAGRHNPDSFYENWLDEPALRREVLDRSDGHLLPTFWDPTTDRATRAAYQPVPANAVVLLAGPLLLGGLLPFDLTIHLSLTPAALARQTPPEQQWTLPAFARYEAEVDPGAVADLVIRVDRPQRPALVEPG